MTFFPYLPPDPDTPAELLAMLDQYRALLAEPDAEPEIPPEMAGVLERYRPMVFNAQRLFRFDNGYGASTMTYRLSKLASEIALDLRVRGFFTP